MSECLGEYLRRHDLLIKRDNVNIKNFLHVLYQLDGSMELHQFTIDFIQETIGDIETAKTGEGNLMDTLGALAYKIDNILMIMISNIPDRNALHIMKNLLEWLKKNKLY